MKGMWGEKSQIGDEERETVEDEKEESARELLQGPDT